MNITLAEDQINSNRWAELADYIYSNLPDGHDFWEKSYLEKNPHIKKYNNPELINKSGVIYVNGHNSLKECIKNLRKDGSYIVISRDRDASINQDIMSVFPRSLKRLYVINCSFKNDVVIPIPVGTATRNGFSESLLEVSKENIQKITDKLIYCRITLTRTHAGKERVDLIQSNRNNPIFTIQMDQVGADEMFRNMKKHIFTACPAGEGKDCLRTYEAITMGSIPLWSDCPELRHFEDLPVVYVRNWDVINKEWCERVLEELSNRKTSTERMRMSYWVNHLQNSKKELL